jgi:hypothetical protein
MEFMEIYSSERTLEIDDGDQKAIAKIKNWVMMVCRRKCNDTNQIFVSPFKYKNALGEEKYKTVICVSANLPEGPIIQIPKALKDVCLTDLLSCYSLINYCK